MQNKEIREYKITSVNTSRDMELFLSLPAKLYDKNHIMQDRDFEKEMLKGEHILCKNVEIFPLIVKDKRGEACGRAVLFLYEGDEKAYIGFFECIEKSEAAKILLVECEKIAKIRGKKSLAGPVNLSFWTGYRFSLREELPYAGEPVNKAYYIDFWEQSGFSISEEYISNFFDVADESCQSKKAKARWEQAVAEGYVFLHPDLNNLIKYLKDIYPLLMAGYKNLPGFKPISMEDFITLYMPLKNILNPEMVFLAYRGEILKGFLICLPDYGNLGSRGRSAGVLLKAFAIKNCAKRYILLYMGVDKDAMGLGSALSYLAKEKLIKKKAASVSALIHKGKATGGYFKDKIKEQRKYVLLHKFI